MFFFYVMHQIPIGLSVRNSSVESGRWHDHESDTEVCVQKGCVCVAVIVRQCVLCHCGEGRAWEPGSMAWQSEHTHSSVVTITSQSHSHSSLTDSIMTVSGVLPENTKPRFRAARTRAPSSEEHKNTRTKVNCQRSKVKLSTRSQRRVLYFSLSLGLSKTL